MLFVRLSALIGIVTMLSGCSWLFPQMTDLEKLHQTYRVEFSRAFVPEAEEKNAGAALCASGGKGENRFPETLQAIRNIRLNDNLASAESAHVTVLEGMIFLQIGHTGTARLLEPAVTKARGNLTSLDKGIIPRDALFAEAYPSLIKGWEAICAPATGNNLQVFEKASFEPKSFAETAGAIQDMLDKHLKRKELGDPQSDEGAIYLATTAAIFDMWTYAAVKERCAFQFMDWRDQCPVDATGLPDNAGVISKYQPWYYAKARGFIEPFLSDTEKQAAKEMGTRLLNNSAGRWRYLAWYSFLCAAPTLKDGQGKGNCIKP